MPGQPDLPAHSGKTRAIEMVDTQPKRDPFHQGPHIYVHTWAALRRSIGPSLRFLFETEVHVYCFAVAANVLISFFPFLVVMTMLCRSVFHWQGAVDVIVQSTNYYFPEGFFAHIQSDLIRTAGRDKSPWISIILILFTANGIFEPLEVALNRIWGVKTNRSFLRNQAVSLGLIFGCGTLVLISICLTAVNFQFLQSRFGTGQIAPILQLIAFEVIAAPVMSLMIFLIYWRLPNAKIPLRRVGLAALFVGLVLEVLKYINVLTWPWLRARLEKEVPPFVQSISIILWAFIAAMILLAGAEWSARVTVEPLESIQN